MIPRPQKTDYIDIHSHHLNKEAGVFRIYNQFFNDGSDTSSSITKSLGLHPWHINEFENYDFFPEILEHLIMEESVVFVGESGLDKLISTSPEQQEDIFFKHILISEKHAKPLIIHCVKAYRELLKIRQKFNPKQAWIIHGFDSSPQLAADLVGKGIYLSIGERLLRKPEKSRNIMANIPLSKLFIETDEDKKSIQELYKDVCKIYQIEEDKLKEYIFENFVKLFQNG